MKRLPSILLAVLLFSMLTSCDSTQAASPKNEIAPAALTTEQQDLMDLFSIPNVNEWMIFRYSTEEMYKQIEVWVEVYQDGEIIDRPAGIGFSSDIAEKHNGRVAISINQHDSHFQWILSIAEHGGKSSHVGRTEAPDDSTFARAYGPINEAVVIEEGKEIILYSSMFSGNDLLPFYDGITLQERPELLQEFPLVYLIKCKFFNEPENKIEETTTKILYQGHGSLRLTAKDGTLVYVDPYAGEGYDLPADLVLVTHQHQDHNRVQLVTQKADCTIITQEQALEGGQHNTFDIKGIRIEAVEAGNQNHDPAQCVGYLVTIDGVLIYVAGDTSKTDGMDALATRGIDYAFLPCDGTFNMDMAEAAECAWIIGAKHNIPYHIKPGALFDQEMAEQFDAPGRMIILPGEEIALSRQ